MTAYTQLYGGATDIFNVITDFIIAYLVGLVSQAQLMGQWTAYGIVFGILATVLTVVVGIVVLLAHGFSKRMKAK